MELPSRKLVLMRANGNNLAVIKSFKDDTLRVLWLAAIYQQQICLIMTQLSYALLGRVQYTRTSNGWNGCSQQVLFSSELKLRTAEQVGIPGTPRWRLSVLCYKRNSDLFSKSYKTQWSKADLPRLGVYLSALNRLYPNQAKMATARQTQPAHQGCRLTFLLKGCWINKMLGEEKLWRVRNLLSILLGKAKTQMSVWNGQKISLGCILLDMTLHLVSSKSLSFYCSLFPI